MDKKELIRISSVKVIAEEGYYNTTIKMIAEEADISVGTIYNYFKNKDEIINYIFEVEHRKRIEFLEKIECENKSIDKKIGAFLDFHFNDLKRNKNVGKVLIQESMLPAKRNIQGIKKFLEDLPVIFTRMLRGAQERDEIRKLNYDLIAHGIFHAIRGVVYNIESTQGRILEQDKCYDVAKTELLEFILNGIKK